MKNNTWIYWLLVPLLPLVQYAVFDRMHFAGYINPQVYLIYLIIFPFIRERSLLLTASFVMGMFLDWLTLSGGIHTFALVLAAYFRIPLLQIIYRKNAGEIFELYSWRNLPVNISIVWILVLNLFFLSVLFILEQGSMSAWTDVVRRTMVTFVLNVLVILLVLSLIRGK